MVNGKKGKIVLALCCTVGVLIVALVLIGLVGIEYPITDPGFDGQGMGYVEPPVFSVQSGFYADPFYLEISVPEGTTVYYTLDCTDPTAESTPYTGPIYLENASAHENTFSMRTDTSACFRTDLVARYSTRVPDYHYQAPDYLIDKCNVVRAVAIDRLGGKSEIVSKSYYVGLDESYSSLRVVSLVTDPDNLFDFYKGIYVTGYYFDNFTKVHTLGDVWGFWDANYRQRGAKWERMATLDISENGTSILSQDVGIRIQGGVSRAYACKSLNIFARNKYSGSEVLEYRLFDSDFFPEKVTLSNGGNRRLTKINDVLMAECTGDMDFATMKFEPCVLFLDGEYWGFFWMEESYTAQSVSYHYGVSEENVLIIKNGEVETGKTALRQYYDHMRHEVTTRDLSLDEEYEAVCSMIDIDSFIDYYAVNAYIGRSEDWPTGNFALWRTLEKEDGAYGDCKWRWMLFDSNSRSMNLSLLKENAVTFIREKDELFASMWRNASFRRAFEERILQIADTCFDPDRVTRFIDEYDAAWHPYLADCWTRFHGSANTLEENYVKEMEGLKEFYSKRKAIVESWFE